LVYGFGGGLTMRRLSLDFARTARPHPAGYALLIASGIAVAVLFRYHASLTDQIVQARTEIEKTEAPKRRPTRDSERQNKEMEQRLQNAQQVLAQLSVPWDRLFRALEAVSEDDVALLGLSPDAAKKQIKLTAEAKNLESMLSFQRKMAENTTFTDISIAEHDVVREDPQQPIRFGVTATWVIEANARK
jgi:hypothetical protein